MEVGYPVPTANIVPCPVAMYRQCKGDDIALYRLLSLNVEVIHIITCAYVDATGITTASNAYALYLPNEVISQVQCAHTSCAPYS